MIDPTPAMRAALTAALRADAGVLAAFAGARVKVYDVPPVNAVTPYLVLGPPTIEPIEAEGFDLSEIDFPVHVWSLTDPPGSAQCDAIAAAVAAMLPGVQAGAGTQVYAATPGRTTHLIDPSDGETAHAIVACTFTTAPAV